MSGHERVIVLFPGAWGNDSKCGSWWMRYARECFERFFKDEQVRFILIRYHGKTMDEYAASAAEQIGDTEDAIGFGYSLGVSIMALTARLKPRALTRAIKFEGDEDGINLGGYLRAMRVLLIPFLVALVTGWMCITSKRALQKVFGSEITRGRCRYHADTVMSLMHAERIWPLLELAFPPLKKRVPALEIPTASIIGGQDLFYREVPKRPNQQVYFHPDWDHGEILFFPSVEEAICEALTGWGYEPPTYAGC
jgi:hypothetical protein